jgi:hypothetical protein
MFHRVALFTASLAAALVVAGGLALAGLTPGQPTPATTQLVQPAAATADAPTQPPAQPAIQIDTVYLTPVSPPQEVTLTKVQVVTKAAPGGDGENDVGD